MKNLKEQFRNLQNHYQAIKQKTNRQYLTMATIRAFAFAITIILAVYWANERQLNYLWFTVLGFIPVFMLLVRLHRRISFKKNLYTFLVDINQQEIERLEGGDVSLKDNGEQFKDRSHPYTYDLDIFGKGSLFGLLCRAGTVAGKRTLANWLSERSDSSAIRKRQNSVEELRPQVEWRQQLQAKALLSEEVEDDLGKLKVWFEQPSVFYKNIFYGIAVWVLPLLFFASVGVWLLWDVPKLVPFLAFVVNLSVLGKNAKHINKVLEETTQSVKVVRAFSLLMKQIEEATFLSPRLQELQDQLKHKEGAASQKVEALQKILSNLEARLNIYFALTVNVAFLFDIFYMIRLEKWKESHKALFWDWVDAVGEVEALSSLSAFAYVNSDYVFPEIIDEGFCVEGKALGHPLIHADERVSNDFCLDKDGKVILITGSNMSGKSTFERTLGINMVLALSGSPVCANQMKASNVQVFTSMRIEDSLEGHISSFYAELKRLHQLIEMLKENEGIFYLLDELLRGTNSEDRQKGVKAIIKQLLATKAAGLISTHDLALVDLANENPDVENFSFNSRIEDGKLIFDYKLHKGACTSFSASALMREMGIFLDED